MSHRSPGFKQHHLGTSTLLGCARHKATSCPTACLFNPLQRDPNAPRLDAYPCLPHVLWQGPIPEPCFPCQETLPAPQCPAGVTTIQGPSFSIHSWPRAASTCCHVHVEWCRNAVQELGTVPAPGGFMGMAISSPMMALGDKSIKTLLLAGSLLLIPELCFSSIPLGLGDHLRSLPCLSSLKISGGGRQECHLWLSGTL